MAIGSIYLTHRGRPVPDRLEALAGLGYRAIAINLHGFAELSAGRLASYGHRVALGAFLAEDTAHKRWITHPDLASARAEAQDHRMPFSAARRPTKPWETAALERRRQRYPSLRAKHGLDGLEASDGEGPPVPHFVCLACEHRWTSHAKVPPCPHCGQRYAAVPDPNPL